MTQEELDMILNAGLEKIAYEEGLNDYADSLEKVAGVHGVDAVDLHDFLEKVAEEDVEDPKWKKWGRRGGIAGGVAGGVPMLVSALKDSDFNVGEAIGASSITGAGGSLAGSLIGAGAGALQPKKKKKEASIDDNTLNYLFEKGLEALTE
jgi:hypothetical protein